MPQTPDEMLNAVSESLAARTGRSLEEWLVRAPAAGGLRAESLTEGLARMTAGRDR